MIRPLCLASALALGACSPPTPDPLACRVYDERLAELAECRRLEGCYLTPDDLRRERLMWRYKTEEGCL